MHPEEFRHIASGEMPDLTAVLAIDDLIFCIGQAACRKDWKRHVGVLEDDVPFLPFSGLTGNIEFPAVGEWLAICILVLGS